MIGIVWFGVHHRNAETDVIRAASPARQERNCVQTSVPVPADRFSGWSLFNVSGWVMALEAPSSHSARSATIGSTRAARRAGSQQASKATPVSANATPQKVAGSVTLTA